MFTKSPDYENWWSLILPQYNIHPIHIGIVVTLLVVYRHAIWLMLNAQRASWEQAYTVFINPLNLDWFPE